MIDLPRLLSSTAVVRAISVGAISAMAFAAPAAHAADSNTTTARKLQALEAQLKQMQGLQDEVRQLRQQLDSVKAGEAQAQSAIATETKIREQREAAERELILAEGGHVVYKDGRAEVIPPKKPDGGVTNKNIKITFGGFIEAAGIYRSKNESADVASTFNNIPFVNSPNAHLSEFRGTARQSRLSILAQGNLDKDTLLSAWYEMDFLGAAPTANSNESNSFNPRIRNIYATVDRTDLGLHVLGGQNWSLATLNRTGITPRNEVAPMGIEAQYVVGFNWLRTPQIRVVKDFDKKVWLGVSLESPAAQISQGPGSTQAAPLTVNNPGAAQLNNGGGAFSLDPGPDVVAKLAVDPGWGHYEVFGITRWFRDRAAFANQTTNSAGVGGSVLLPLVEKKLDFQASFLVGKGMGRFGSGQLADVTTDNLGHFVALPYKSVLLGVVAHPTSLLDLYAYAGTEQLEKRYNTVGTNFYGYGNPSATNDTGCLTESAGTCNGATAREYEITGGFWYKFYQGSVGYMQIGIQDQYVKRYVFAGPPGGAPGAGINIAMVSFRYYPF